MSLTGPGALTAWWRQRLPRERWLLTACALALVVLLGDVLALAPLERRLKAVQAEREQRQERAAGAEAERRRQRADDVDSQARERELHQRLRAAQQRLQALEAQLSASAQLPDILRAVVATVGSARVVELRVGADPAAAAVAAVPAPAAATAASAGAMAGDGAAPASARGPGRTLHRLPITLTVAGTWDELVLVTAQIERHATALQWSAVQIDGTEWPAIRFTLHAHVPSLRARWGAAP